MFPLPATAFPSTSAQLSQLLNESIRRVVRTDRDPVTVQGDSYPELERIEVNLNGGEVRLDLPRPPVVSGERTAALRVGNLRVNASALAIGPVTADLRLTARDVSFDQARDSEDEIVLVVRRAADGEIDVTADKSNLEAAIATVARHEADKQGVIIEEVSLVLDSLDSRSVTAEVRLKARKLFFSTVIRIAGTLALDDQLNASLSAMECKGDGAIGALACGVLSPHLQKLEGRAFPLMALPLGDIRLRDVRISVADRITVSAAFGA